MPAMFRCKRRASSHGLLPVVLLLKYCDCRFFGSTAPCSGLHLDAQPSFVRGIKGYDIDSCVINNRNLKAGARQPITNEVFSELTNHFRMPRPFLNLANSQLGRDLSVGRHTADSTQPARGSPAGMRDMKVETTPIVKAQISPQGVRE